MAFVTNASPLPKKVSAYVIADGVTYNLAPVQLQPFATHVYDVDAMRADQVADFKGVRIPLSSRSGKFQRAGDPKDNNVGLIGRMEVLSRKDKRASSFSCGGSCPANSTAPIFSGPTFGNFPIGGTAVLTAVEHTYDSYGNPISEPLTGSQTSLSSSVPQVISLNGNPSSTQIPLAAMSSGSSNMSYTQVTNTYYPANGYSCQDFQNNSPGGGVAVVQVPTSLSAPTLPGVKSQTSGPINGYFGNPEITTSECGVYEYLVSDLLDQNGSKITSAFTLSEMFSGYTTTVPGATAPATQSSSQNTLIQRLADTQFFGTRAPACLGSNDNEAFNQTFSVALGGKTYMLTTVRHIAIGYFKGTPNVTVTTTTK